MIENQHGAISLVAYHHAIENLALAILEILVDRLPFRFADFLEDELPRGLGNDPAQLLIFNFVFHLVTRLREGIQFARFFQGDLVVGILQFLPYRLVAKDFDIAGFHVEPGFNVFETLEFPFGRRGDRFLDHFDQPILFDALFACDIPYRFQYVFLGHESVASVGMLCLVSPFIISGPIWPSRWPRMADPIVLRRCRTSRRSP